MQDFFDMFPINDNHQPVRPIRYRWWEKIMGLCCGMISAWVLVSGLYAAFVVAGLIPAMAIGVGIFSLIYAAVRMI